MKTSVCTFEIMHTGCIFNSKCAVILCTYTYIYVCVCVCVCVRVRACVRAYMRLCVTGVEKTRLPRTTINI